MRRPPKATSAEEFALMPRHPGWKIEYIGGKAHFEPSFRVALVSMPVRPCSVRSSLPLRPVIPTDKHELIAADYDSFWDSVEYCNWPKPQIRKAARETIEGYFAGDRGKPMSASRVAIETVSGKERILGAALLVRDKEGPYIDSLFVRPEAQRQGIATALVSGAMNALHEAGEQTLASGYHLANEASIAWHTQFGFVEEPDLSIAQGRLLCARHELRRRDKMVNLSNRERSELETECRRLETLVDELLSLRKQHGFDAVTPFLRRSRA